MKPVYMTHPKSKVTILVQAGQVGNAKYHGWIEADPAKPESVTKPKRGKKDGKS